jgi:hypothetical protein
MALFFPAVLAGGVFMEAPCGGGEEIPPIIDRR